MPNETLPVAAKRRPWWSKILRWAGIILGLLVFVAALRAWFAFRDRIPGYSLDVRIDAGKSKAEPRQLRAGFARVKITPDLSNPKRPVWLAGFSNHRAATAVHDDLWAVACVISDGWNTVGIVALDAIGFFQDDVVRVRRRLSEAGKLDHVIICSTHNHSTPDLMGLWGPDFLHSGVDPAYKEQVITACVESLTRAAAGLEPAGVAFHEIPVEPKQLMTDTRKPEVYDPDLRLMHFVKAGTSETLGTIVAWADHPETPWGENTELTSDFCGYLRDSLRDGVTVNGRKYEAGVGGIHLYVNGAVGGLMTTSPGVTVRDPYLDQDFKSPSHDKARALGHQLAFRVLPTLRQTNTVFSTTLPLSIRAKTIPIRLDNKLYLLAGYLGILDRGYTAWRTLRTEVGLVTLGDATIACIPGEIYPEIVNGGIVKAPGGDFDIEPLEVPSIREFMPGRVKFVFGLANDEIGYIIPKSEWDEKPPYLFGASHRPYGEINSVGSEAGPSIHHAIRAICRGE
jgi:hypothetical protein